MSTPLKFSKPVCIVCGKLKPDRYSLLQSSHSLTQLIFRYCEIDVAEGIVCRNCSRQLNNLHEKDGLLRLSWIEICNEFKEQFPKVFYLIPDLNESNFVDNILPRIGMIYAVIMQTRACDMSLIQRIVSLILLNANTEIQVSVNCLICNISFCILSFRGC